MKALIHPCQLDLAVSLLQQGSVLAIPTETVYGLAANIHLDNAVKQIFTLKNRPINHPLIIHISECSQLAEYAVDIPDYVYKLTEKFWPGPLTVVLSKSHRVSDCVTGGQQSVGIRMPAHPLALELIRRVGAPLAAPSANRFGCISPTLAQHVVEGFEGLVPVVDGGACSVGIESTIIDATSPDFCTILRPGMISQEDLQDLIPNIEVRTPEGAIKKVSGTLKHHYAPTKPNFFISNAADLDYVANQYKKSVYFLSLSESYAHYGLAGYRMPEDPELYAQKLYEQLLLADNSTSVVIAIESPPCTVMWQGILDRLIKSTAKSMEWLHSETIS